MIHHSVRIGMSGEVSSLLYRPVNAMRLLTISIFLSVAVCGLAAQSKSATKDAKKAERAEIERVIKAYTSCTFDDGLRISRVDRIQSGGSKFLARPTAKGLSERGTPPGKSEERYYVDDNGLLNEGVSRTHGYRVMVDYRKPDFFANIRIDRSDPAGYEEDKQILERWFNFIHSERPDSDASTPIVKDYNGLRSISTYRSNVDVPRNELGLSLLFDDANKIYVSIYFLNQRPKNRVHKSTDDWKEMRERLLVRYSKCVRENLDS